MRKTIFIISALQVLLVIAIAVRTILYPVDIAGAGTAYVIPQVYGLMIVIAVVPAMILAYTDRWQWLGLAMSLLPLIPLAMMLSV